MCRLRTLLFLLVALSIAQTAQARPPSAHPALVLQLGNPLNSTVWAFAARAPVLACGISDGVQVWDTRTWDLVRTLPVPRVEPGLSPSAFDVALSPDGKTLAAVAS